MSRKSQTAHILLSLLHISPFHPQSTEREKERKRERERERMCLCSSFVLFRHQRDQHVPNPSGVAFAMAAVVGTLVQSEGGREGCVLCCLAALAAVSRHSGHSCPSPHG